MLPGRLWLSRIVRIWSFIDFPALYVTTIHRIILQNHKLFRLNDPSLKHPPKREKYIALCSITEVFYFLPERSRQAGKQDDVDWDMIWVQLLSSRSAGLEKMFMKCCSCPFSSFCNRFSLLCCCCCCCCFPSLLFLSCFLRFCFPLPFSLPGLSSLLCSSLLLWHRFLLLSSALMSSFSFLSTLFNLLLCSSFSDCMWYDCLFS